MTTTEVERIQRSTLDRGVPPAARRAPRAVAAPLLVWCAVIALGAVLVYVVLVATGEKRLDGAPLQAAFSPAIGWGTLVPVAVLVVTIVLAPRLATMRWRPLLCTWWLTAVVWALAVALLRGPHRVVAPLENADDYTAVLPRISSAHGFLQTFVARIATYPVHVQGHPPGLPLAEWALRRLGAGGPVPLALVMIGVGCAAVPLVLTSAREVVSEEWARRAAPFLAVGPSAIWIATSADAVFAGVGAGAATLVILATGSEGARGKLLAFGGGLAFGLCAFLSYGLVLLALIPLVIVVSRRRFGVLAMAVVGAVPVFAAFALGGFWWLDGLVATRHRYLVGIASRRPYELFLIANVAILAIVVGPAVAVALWRLRSRACWLLVGGAMLALVLADLSGMSKSEVERIWLPFVPFVVLSAGTLNEVAPTGRPGSLPSLRGGMGWLALQGCAAILIESVVRTAW